MTPLELSVEAVGVAAFATNVLGNLLVVRKSANAFAVRLFSNALWLGYGWWLGQRSPSVILNALVFAGINIWGWRRWAREARGSGGL